MSPSSTNRGTLRRSRGWGFTTPGPAGLSIGREHIHYVELAKTGQKWGLRHVGETKTNAALFTDANPAPGASLLAALTALLGDRAPRFGPLHVSVPDAAVRVSLFELDAVPASRAAQDAFVEFRMGRERGDTKHRYASQPLGRGRSGKQLLLGLALEERWHVAIEGALQETGLRAWSLNANALRSFNLHHDQISIRSGALVTAEPDSWSLMIWDAGGLLRYSRAQWRVDGLNAKEIAAEIERSILGYVHSEKDRAVDQIWLGAGADTAELKELLNTRTDTPCQLLNATDQIEPDTAPDLTRCEAALAAALQP